MNVKQLHAADGQRVFAVILETGEAVMECLQRFAEAERLTAAQITGIGAFSEAGLRYFDWERKEYLPIPVQEQVEVASLIGDVAVSPEGKPALHVHLVLGRRSDAFRRGDEPQASQAVSTSRSAAVTPAREKV